MNHQSNKRKRKRRSRRRVTSETRTRAVTTAQLAEGEKTASSLPHLGHVWIHSLKQSRHFTSNENQGEQKRRHAAAQIQPLLEILASTLVHTGLPWHLRQRREAENLAGRG